MRVLVTGGAGFIGGYVVAALTERGLEAAILDRRAVPQRLPAWFGDVRDATAVSEAVASCDAVIHLAGVLGTAETIDNPWPAIEVNVQGSLNVFQACRQHRKRCAYITVGNHWMHNSYSITKTAAERLAWMFNREHGCKIAVVRALNAYGPGQKAWPVRKIMPNLILPAVRGEAMLVYGDGLQVMDMIHVRDVAEVMVRALLVDHDQYVFDPRQGADSPCRFEAGTGRRTTVLEIAELVLKEVGGGRIEHVSMRPGEPPGSVVLGSPDTLRPLYDGARPDLIDLETGTRETVAWFRRHHREYT